MIPLFSVLWFPPPKKTKRIAEKLLLRKPIEPVVCPSTRFGADFEKPDFLSNVDKPLKNLSFFPM